ncbi:MAG: hypothetical protein ABEH88_05400 [Halobacteriales archaeon]
MKVYPKVPRYDHPVVPPGFLEAPDLALLEKIDGSSFRFTLYEERFAERYPEQLTDAVNGDGSLVFGTRMAVRGSHDDPLTEVDGALRRAVRCLRNGIDPDALRRAHDDFGAALELFDRVRLPDASTEHSLVPAPVLDRPEAFDPGAYDFPASSLAGDVRVEGVVIRSDDASRRAKLVREAFRELNREQFGKNPEEAQSGAEYVVAAYCTPARIRKHVRRMVVEEGREFGLHLNDDLYPRVVEDLWAENWPDLMELDVAFTPAEVYPIVAKRCIQELRQMETNAALNDADPTTLWRHLSE